MILICSILYFLILGCFTRKSGNMDSESWSGRYMYAAIDSSIYGKYLAGRWLSGIKLNLMPNGVFEKNFFCDICPKYKRYGNYSHSEDTIYLKDTLIKLEKGTFGGKEEYSYWYNGDSSLNTDTLYRWKVNGLFFIGRMKQNDSITRYIKQILEIPNELVKMDLLPFRKVGFE